MAVCSLTRFTITRGVDNEFFFTVKANGSLLPMVIEPLDTFQVKLVRLDDNTTADIDRPLEVVDAANGKLRFLVTEAESMSLLSERGQKEDRYYLKPVYKLLLEATTVNNGSFIAQLGKVYVG